jgi:DNA-binding LacI/PurR family transcriptional regulator
LEEPPTAIVAASDTQALGVLETAREVDIPVPEALSVIGYDDIEIAEYFHLTTVRQPLFESGWRGTHLLLSIIESDEVEPIADKLPLELVVRETTAEPARQRVPL